MSKRSKVFLAILLAYSMGVGSLIYRQLEDIDPRYRESTEESLVETAQMMASWIELQSSEGQINIGDLRALFQSVLAKRFKANIFGFEKTRVELRMLVVDRAGRVLFDSEQRHEGEDFSTWRDIRLSLAGKYGARTSNEVAGDPNSAVLFVATPIHHQQEIVGAVSIGKPAQSLGQFVEAARHKTLMVGLTSAASVIVLALMLSMWLLTSPFGMLADLLRHVRTQRSFDGSRLFRRAIRGLGTAYADMRDTLAGHNYVADYVQTLTHEVKSPLSAIRGAAELLQEPMPDTDRARFASNIAQETQRIQELIDRMMELTVLESRHHLRAPTPIDLRLLIEDMAQRLQASGAPRNISISVTPNAEQATVVGDAFLLKRALSNLIDNAMDFSPEGGSVTLTLSTQGRRATITVRDHGPGIPDYARSKVFEKFYSLARPHSQKRSTGLGLSFVKEIVNLHHGEVTLNNAPDGGALATFWLPIHRAKH